MIPQVFLALGHRDLTTLVELGYMLAVQEPMVVFRQATL